MELTRFRFLECLLFPKGRYRRGRRDIVQEETRFSFWLAPDTCTQRRTW